MRSEITNIISPEDHRKIKSMMQHQYDGTELHPHVHLENEQYRIDGISHLSDDTIIKTKIDCGIEMLKSIICTEWNIDNTYEYKKSKIVSVTEKENNEEYVYDVSMAGLNNYYFANNLLMHNTDSVVLLAALCSNTH